MTACTGYFYLPRGCFTSFELLSILYKCAPTEPALSLTLKFNDQTIALTGGTNDNGLMTWSANNFSAFSDAHASDFRIIYGNSLDMPASFNQLRLISLDETFDPAELPSHIIIFRFSSGYYARSPDYRMHSLKVVNAKATNVAKRESYKKACTTYQEHMRAFNSAFSSKWAAHYANFQKSDATRRSLSVQHYRQYQQSVRTCPKANESYAADREETVVAKVGTAEGSSSLFMARMSSGDLPVKVAEAPDPVLVFPKTRAGPKSPSISEIRMCLEELAVIFFTDPDKRTFCGICEDDPDLEVQKMFLFNVLHFLTLFSEFTGMLFDVRISLSEGWYKLEDRVTGLEIKRDTMTAKTVVVNPYRSAVLACLKKIATEFHLEPKGQDFVPLMSAILQFHLLLVDS
jgi:hypothetical protein